MSDPQLAAQLLFDARRPGNALKALPDDALPKNKAQAYAAQAALVTRLKEHAGLPVGYKVGCTNATAREMLALDSPFSGRCFKEEISISPARVNSETLHMVGIEPEIAIRLGQDLSPGVTWTTDQIMTAVDSVMPAIEVVESRFSTWPLMGFLSAIADNGVHRHLVLGEPLSGWTRSSVEAIQVTLKANDRIVREGHAMNVDGGPFGVVTWLANHLNAMGVTLKAGEIVSTGVMTDIYDSAAGESLVAQYDFPATVQVSVI